MKIYSWLSIMENFYFDIGYLIANGGKGLHIEIK
jgi:hypothetical protein